MSSPPDRSLHLTGASNFRDLGGYRAADGRVVRWRRLFRSDHLAALTAGDTQVLEALGVTRAVDFRGGSERAAAAYQLPGVVQYPLPIEPTVVQGMQSILAAGELLTAQRTVELMCLTYRNFVRHNAPRFADLFAQLLRSDEPLVFHCTAGKDRTGYAAALILLALGVPRSAVMHDYLLTNDCYRMPAASDPRIAPEVLNVLWRVQSEFLDAALQTVDEDFGGLDAYLAKQLGVGVAAREQLRRLYLQVPVAA
ncbi:MAG: tyrosine-protein phosphatase [Burkholderiaceae bacterium]